MKPGDVVQLLSGGALMTIEKIAPSVVPGEDDVAMVVWFDEHSTLLRSRMAVTLLKPGKTA